jgi:hypothetical protein
MKMATEAAITKLNFCKGFKGDAAWLDLCG